MSVDRISDTNSPWQLRISAANKAYVEWEGRFKCKLLEDYYEGFQWKQRRDYPTTNYNPYMLNLVLSTIQIKLSGLLFQKPKFLISPTPGNSNWNLEQAVNSSQLKEDVLNTIVSNRNTKFKKHIKLAALDSFFRFGLIECGYAADWRNPLKVDPQLKSWDDPDIPEDEDKVVEDNPVNLNERFYVKRVRPNRFRCAVSESTDLEDHDWVGYYEYYYTKTLMNTPGIDWPEDHNNNSYVSAEYANGFVGRDTDNIDHQLFIDGGISRCWHIWDNVSGKRLLLLDDDRMSELWSKPQSHLPLIDLRWIFRLKGFYPVPVVFNWLSPQDEINEAREQTRSYRRRFTRKFQALKNMVDEEEKEKFASGPDGIIIEVKQIDAIRAIDNPEQGPTAENALLLAKDDFNIISGTSAEARGQSSDRETATQAKLVQQRSLIRESAEQLDFSDWLSQIGQEIMQVAENNMQDGIWIRANMNPGGIINPAQQQAFQQAYQWITSQHINDGYDYEVQFDVQNATPAAMQQAQESFVNFFALLAQFPMIAMNPVLVREAAYRVGYRNEAIIKQAQDSAQAMALMQQLNQQQQQQPGNGGQNPHNAGKTRSAQMGTPTLPEIGNQIGVQ